MPSVSFQSLPAPRPDYDPGLAILTLRCSAAGGRTAPRAALRLVHGSADLQAALARAAGTEGEAGKERGAEAGETFWSLDLPGTVLQPDVRARVSRVWKLKRQSVKKN